VSVREWWACLLLLWSAVSSLPRCASRVSEGLVGVPAAGGNVRVYSVYGLGFGSDVTVVVRLDEQGH